MQEPKIPDNEKQRQAAVDELRIVDTPPEERFDRITRLATKLFNVPISTITIIDHDREWFKSCVGLPETEGPRAISFCAHCILNKGILYVPDATKDERFADNPTVVGEPFIRFYAGVPLYGPGGQSIGTLCIIDLKPRTLSEEQQDDLKELAAWAQLELNDMKGTLGETDEMKRISEIMMERELKMVELKKEIEGLKKKLGGDA